MPDDTTKSAEARPIDLHAAIPVALMAAGAASLLRGAPLISLGLLSCWLYQAARKGDRERHERGRSLKARRAAAARLDVALADSFPASDPPSLGGITRQARA